jgi:hypothetical protein
MNGYTGWAYGFWYGIAGQFWFHYAGFKFWVIRQGMNGNDMIYRVHKQVAGLTK